MDYPSEDELVGMMSNGQWLRRFVAGLVPAQDVDDVVQSTWLAGLQARGIGRLRSWLRGAAANLARLRHRSQARRQRALQDGPRREHAPSTADVVATLEVQRLVSDALLALPEPTRTIVVLRYYQRLEPAAIATRVGLQVGAVRQRLHRGREAVRVRLQQHFGDDWRGCIAVLAFGRDGSVPATAAPVRMVALGLAGAAAMTIVLLASTPNAVRAMPQLGPSDATASTSPGAKTTAAVVVSSTTAVVERVLVAPPEQDPTPASSRPPALRGRVIAAETGRPLAGVRVVPNPRWEPGVPEAERAKIVTLVTGLDGTFAFPLPARAISLHVWFEAEGRSPRDHDADPPKAGDLGDVPMHLGFEVKGRLLDEGGMPVAHVRLALPIPCGFPDDRKISFPCTTNEHGEFAWKRVPSGRVDIQAAGPGQQLLDGNIEVVARAEPNEFVLRCRRLPVITGVAFAVDGTPCANLEITAFDGPIDMLLRGVDIVVGRCRTRPDGSFALHRNRGDSEQVDLRSSIGFMEVNLFEPLIDVRWGTSGVRLQARPHADVALRVIDAEKRTPIERFAVQWTFARGISRMSSGGGRPEFHVQAMQEVGRVAHGTRILVWSDDPMQAQVEVVVTEAMCGRTTLEVALPRMQSFPCEFVDAHGRPIAGTFHLLDRNGVAEPQMWSDPRGGKTRTGKPVDVYRLHTVVSDKDGKGSIVAPTDGRDLVVVRDGPQVREWFPVTLPKPGERLRVVVPE